MKYPEGSDLRYDQVRIELGGAVRRLGHAVIGHEVDIQTMEETRALLNEISESFELEQPRFREFSHFSGGYEGEVPDHARLTSHVSRPGSGWGSPHSLEMVVHRRGDKIEAIFTLGSSHEGAPQRSHGGIVALAFDDAMGFVLNVLKIMAFTGELKIRYHAPTLLKRELVLEAWLDRREGRKLFIDAHLRENVPDSPVLASAQAIFIAIESY